MSCCRVLLMIFSASVLLFAQGHGWEELATPDLAQQHIEQLLVIVEEQQANATSVTRLQGQVYAKDWLEHFSDTIELHTFTGQADFSTVIAALYPDEEEVFLNWQHDMEHIVHVYDASIQTTDIDEASILSELENLSLDEETADDANFYRAAELSYLLSFIDISEADIAVIAPFSARISQLIESAKGRE